MKKWIAGLALPLLVVAIAMWRLPVDRESGEAPQRVQAASSSVIERGRELVTLADCKTCHTTRGGAAYAGDRAIPTPFGTFYTPNITPDVATGIGSWTEEDFWRALHNGRSRDGWALYPAFPYTNYTKVSRADARAMFEYLKTVQPARYTPRDHALAFPYNLRPLLIAWRWLYFSPGVYEPDPAKGAEWNRGAYLVQGVAHCSACHESRNALGANESAGGPAGGLVLNWYAPALTSSREAGLRGWSEADIVSFLKSGRTAAHDSSPAHASAMGPMAEVVFESLQHAAPDELHAMAVYLNAIPESEARKGPARPRLPNAARNAVLESGRRIYEEHCARCHGDNGEGRSPAAIALAGNRAVTLDSPVNIIRVVLYGGYPPGTVENPRPFGMPPYSHTLTDRQIAEVVSFIRNAWGNDARGITNTDVARSRTGPLW